MAKNKMGRKDASLKINLGVPFKTNKRASLQASERASRRDNMKQYKLSIVMSDKSYVCNNINDEDIIIKEFEHYDEADSYINNNFKKIKNGNNYNYYIKKEDNE